MEIITVMSLQLKPAKSNPDSLTDILPDGRRVSVCRDHFKDGWRWCIGDEDGPHFSQRLYKSRAEAKAALERELEGDEEEYVEEEDEDEGEDDAPVSPSKTATRFVGWWRPDESRPWKPMVYDADEARCFNRLLSRIEGGDKCIVKSGINPNRSRQ